MELTSKDIEAVANLAKEAQQLRNEVARLRGHVHALRRSLRDVSANIDVSTINRSKRSLDRWAVLRIEACATLAACPEPKP
jgi:hypothetical protein